MNAVDAWLAAPVQASVTRPLPAPADFWCEGCRKYLPTAQSQGLTTAPLDGPLCAGCGEVFTCGECGSEIDEAGDCLRQLDEGTCPGVG